MPAQVQTRLLLHTRALNVSKAAAIRARSAAAAVCGIYRRCRPQAVQYLAAAVPARRGLGDDLQSCAVLLLVAMRLELKYSRVAVSRAAHATHSHEYGGVIQLIVMSQAACFNSTRLTLIMTRVAAAAPPPSPCAQRRLKMTYFDICLE